MTFWVLMQSEKLIQNSSKVKNILLFPLLIRENKFGKKLLLQLELLDLGLIQQVFWLKVLMKLTKLQATSCQLTG
jgi:hypothetical protein